eukprot:521100_1
MSVKSTEITETTLQTHDANTKDGMHMISPLMGATWSPAMVPNFDLFPRRRGSSNISWQSNRSFNFGTITPLNIPQSSNGMKVPSLMDQDLTELPQSAYAANPTSLSTVSSIDTANYDTQDFVRSAPLYNGRVNGWDEAITSFQTPTGYDPSNAMDLDSAMDYGDNNTELPQFMKSSFYMGEMSRRTSIESTQSLGNPNHLAPQSAPSTYDFMAQQQIFGKDDWSGLVNDAFCPPQQMVSFAKEPASITVSESDIFGSNTHQRNRNWSTMTTESENEPIIKLAGMKRHRGKSLSDSDLHMPPQQRIRTNTNDHTGTPIVPHDLPPRLYNGNAPGITNGVHHMNINGNPHNAYTPRKRGRPRKTPQAAPKNNTKATKKYGGLKKSEREKLRRKELKEGYESLTELLHLEISKSGAALPDRSVIVSAACDEIKRLEHMLFEISMRKNAAKKKK